MNEDNPRKIVSGWTHQRSRRMVSPNRRRTTGMGALVTATLRILEKIDGYEKVRL
jgi:hypothetical protein